MFFGSEAGSSPAHRAAGASPSHLGATTRVTKPPGGESSLSLAWEAGGGGRGGNVGGGGRGGYGNTSGFAGRATGQAGWEGTTGGNRRGSGGSCAGSDIFFGGDAATRNHRSQPSARPSSRAGGYGGSEVGASFGGQFRPPSRGAQAGAVPAGRSSGRASSSGAQRAPVDPAVLAGGAGSSRNTRNVETNRFYHDTQRVGRQSVNDVPLTADRRATEKLRYHVQHDSNRPQVTQRCEEKFHAPPPASVRGYARGGGASQSTYAESRVTESCAQSFAGESSACDSLPLGCEWSTWEPPRHLQRGF